MVILWISFTDIRVGHSAESKMAVRYVLAIVVVDSCGADVLILSGRLS